MKWLLVLSLVACQPSAAVTPTASPTPVITPTPVVITPAPTPVPTPWVPALDPRRLVVGISGQVAAGERAQLIATSLPKMWGLATKGRSQLTLVNPRESLAPIFLVVLDEQMTANGTVIRGHTQWLAGERIRLINVYRTTDNLQLMQVVLHELGHALGCCHGPEADAGLHWRVCGEEMMCHPLGKQVTFSERELAQMGLR